MRAHLGWLPIVVMSIVLVWNVVLAGWMAARREGPQWFARLSGLAGLLIAPAAVLSVAVSSDAGARTITGVAWLWPATCLLLVLQATAATGLRYVSSTVGVPIIAYNVLLAMIAFGDDAVARSGNAPLLLQGAVAARDAVLGIVMGPAALTSPLVLLVPLLAPAYPARWRTSATFRALLVLVATVITTLLAMEWPRGVAVVRSYDGVSTDEQPRNAASFARGVRMLPVLAGAPATRAIRTAARLNEQVAPDAVLIVLRSRGAQVAGLDSLTRVLAPYRENGVRVLVALTFERDDALAVQRAPAATSAQRLAALRDVVERLRPDVVFPVLRGVTPTLRAAPELPVAWLSRHLSEAAATVSRVRPATQVGWIATRFDEADSTLYDWAASDSSPLRALGFAPAPSFSGLPSLDARLRAADRWRAASSGPARPHWLLTSGLPRAHGDAAQRAAVLHVVAWGSRRDWVRGVIVGEPTDDAATTGLIAANARERAVVDALRRAR